MNPCCYRVALVFVDRSATAQRVFQLCKSEGFEVFIYIYTIRFASVFDISITATIGPQLPSTEPASQSYIYIFGPKAEKFQPTILVLFFSTYHLWFPTLLQGLSRGCWLKNYQTRDQETEKRFVTVYVLLYI